MKHPTLEAVVMPDGDIQLEWSEAPGPLTNAATSLQTEIFARYTGDPANWLLALGFCPKAPPLAPSVSFWRTFAGLFTRKLSLTPELEGLRGEVALSLTADERENLAAALPPMTGSEHVNGEFLAALWSSLHTMLAGQLSTFAGTVAEFIKGYNPELHLVGRVYFHLVENKNGADPFAFLATYSTALNAEGESKHLPLRYALEEYADDHAKLLELLVTVHAAARESTLIADLLESGELFSPLSWPAREAYRFLQEIPLYEKAGILCRIPNWWKGQAPRIGLAIRIGDQTPAMVGMHALLDFQPRLMLGDAELSEEEARLLLTETEGLAFIKNKWVAVDPDKLRQTLAAYSQAQELGQDAGITFFEAMRLSLNPGRLLGAMDNGTLPGITHGQWLREVLDRLRRPETMPESQGQLPVANEVKATLRGYQRQGVEWLLFLQRLGFGACLADDMGLGKTLQVLAFLMTRKREQAASGRPGKASLLILPASLLANWLSEIERFTPGLSVFAAHPEMHRPQPMPEPSPKELDATDLVITTYTVVQRHEWLTAYAWETVILDEAQAIKNPGTKQTKAVKGLSAKNRIIITGTPVENRVSDLWSLFDFCNPGLLGSAKEFTAFSKGLRDSPSGYAGLRRVVSPFILRRMKTDKRIIADLPDKVEVKTWAPLSKKQTVLYAEVIHGIRETLAQADGIQRKGVILAALMKFKQLCNHPSQYLGLTAFDEKESGKFARLREICETIHDKRERVLVFTQFQEMTAPLARFLATIFQREGLVLHGGVPVAKRRALIEQFQGHAYVPFFVLSLKAGGVGLNLTAANHVIHFDRWWNPAVENQATDRAFRIGQQKNVMVHKFLTKGTIEEKIDAMLEQKSKLSRDLIADSGEGWITEMNNDQLFELFTLQL